MARDKDFDLRAALGKPSFTAGQRDIAALVSLVATDEDAAVRASPALAKLGDAARNAITDALALATTGDAVRIEGDATRRTRGSARENVARGSAESREKVAIDDGGAARENVARGSAESREKVAIDDGGAARLVVPLGLMARAGDRTARAELIARLGDPRVRVRRAAIIALGKLGATRATRADDRDEPRRAPSSEHDARDAADAGKRSDVHPAPDAGARSAHLTRDRLVDLREGARRENERRADEKPPLVDLRESERRGDDRRASEPDDDVRAALIARWDAPDVPPDERRALAEALGKIGGAGVRERLEALDAHSDKELARRRDRALLVADREEKRGEDSEVIADRAPPRPLVVRLGCRPALAELLISEARAAGFDGKAVRDDAVDVPLDRPWSALFASRLWATAAIRVEDRALRAAKGDRAKVTDAVVRAIVSDEIRGLLSAWTRGPIRWRLSLARGHQRAVVWTVAKEVTRRAPMLINDPTQTTWDIRVDDEEGAIELVPRRAEDPRFAYRVAEVPAASHPSVAAAAAWLAKIEPGERVWDPFCGSGLELAECALRGAGTLIGSDVDDAALAAARANLDAVGITTHSPTLARGDARAFAAGPVDAIVTNPPLGSRVHVDAGALLAECLPHFARQLRVGGRLVWITPQWRRTTPVAEAHGLVLVRSLFVDLGGVRGRLERWDRRR